MALVLYMYVISLMNYARCFPDYVVSGAHDFFSWAPSCMNIDFSFASVFSKIVVFHHVCLDELQLVVERYYSITLLLDPTCTYMYEGGLVGVDYTHASIHVYMEVHTNIYKQVYVHLVLLISCEQYTYFV